MRRSNPPRGVRLQKIVATIDRGPKVPQRTLQTPEDVAVSMVEYIGSRPSEVFVVIYINVRNKFVGYTEYTEGNDSGVSVHPTGIFRAALLAGAAALITVHQHPSGDPTPSVDDRALWGRLREAGKIMGIPVIDNLVIGDESYFSESQEGAARYPVEVRTIVQELRRKTA